MNFNVKITCDEECRRFAFSKQETFANFVQTVKNLFGKTEEEQLNVLYLDDEKEWVKISTELEWTHLVQNIPVFNNALRVRVGADKAKKPISRCERAKAETSTSPKRAFKCRKGGERLPFLHQIMQQISQFKSAEVSTNNNSAASASTGSEQNGGYKVGAMFNEVLAALSNLQGKPQEEVKTQPQEEKLENQAQPQPQVQPEQVQEQEVPQPAPVEAVVQVEAPVVEEVVVMQQAEVPQVGESQPVEQEPVIFQQAPAEFLVVAPPAPAPAAEQTAVVYPPVFVQEEQPAVKQPEPEPYSHELVSLEMMGFSNKALNLHLLKHFKGDMAKAIDSLLNM